MPHGGGRGGPPGNDNRGRSGSGSGGIGVTDRTSRADPNDRGIRSPSPARGGFGGSGGNGQSRSTPTRQSTPSQRLGGPPAINRTLSLYDGDPIEDFDRLYREYAGEVTWSDGIPTYGDDIADSEGSRLLWHDDDYQAENRDEYPGQVYLKRNETELQEFDTQTRETARLDTERTERQETERVDAERTSRYGEISNLWGQRLTAASEAVYNANDRIRQEQSSASVQGLTYGISDTDRQSRINNEFATLWSEDRETQLSGLTRQYGNPEQDDTTRRGIESGAQDYSFDYTVTRGQSISSANDSRGGAGSPISKRVDKKSRAQSSPRGQLGGAVGQSPLGA